MKMCLVPIVLRWRIVISQGSTCILLAFCQFEICVGLFWPSLGTMRSNYIPEAGMLKSLVYSPSEIRFL